jgi:hypothetical protein
VAEEAKAVTTQELTPIEVVQLPNAHVDHTANLHNELQNRRHGFLSGLQALNAAKEGAETDHNQALAEANEKHLKAMADLDRRIADVERALSAVEKGIADIDGTAPAQQQ